MAKTEQNKKTNKPIKKFMIGSVSASVFKKHVKTEENDFNAYNVSIQKSYKDDNDEWQNTNNFNDLDLGNVIGVSFLAQAFIASERQKDYESNKNDE